MDTKLVGYSLLVVGLIIIAGLAFNLFSIVRGASTAPEYFSFPAISISSSALVPDAPSESAQNLELLPAKTINNTTNLAMHLFVLGLGVTIGARISQLGVEMLRPVKVVMRNQINNEQKKEINTQ